MGVRFVYPPPKERIMSKDIIMEYFACSKCGNTRFTKHYEFSISFHKVNFSDGLVYDKHTDEICVCTKCGSEIGFENVQTGLREIKQKQKAIGKDDQDGM